MSKFRVRLKIENFELEIDGTRDEIPLITQAVGDQIAGMLTPTSEIVEGEIVSSESDTSDQTTIPQNNAGKKRKRKSQNPRSGNKQDDSSPIAFRHDSSKYGAPSQKWTAVQKAMWLLFVVENETGIKDLSTVQIRDTFNTQFRQAGMIRSNNLNRDLGKQKVRQNGLPTVGEETSANPSKWFLTDAGKDFVRDLIAKTPATQSNNT